MTFLNYINNILRRYQKEQLKKQGSSSSSSNSSSNIVFSNPSAKRKCPSTDLKSNNDDPCRLCGNNNQIIVIIQRKRKKSPTNFPNKIKTSKIHHSTLLDENKQRLTLKRSTQRLSPSFIPTKPETNLPIKRQPLHSTFKKSSNLYRATKKSTIEQSIVANKKTEVKKRLVTSTFRIDYASTPIKTAPKTSTPRKVPTIESSTPVKLPFPVL